MGFGQAFQSIWFDQKSIFMLLKENIFVALKVFWTISQVKLKMKFTCVLEKEI